MSPFLVRLIAACIPSKVRRHAFREKYLKPRKTSPANAAGTLPPDLDKRLKAIENRLDLLVRFSFQKEIYPELGKSYCANLPADTDVLEKLRAHTYTNSGAGAAVKRQYLAEQISLCAAFIHILPDEETFRAFRKLLSLCAQGDTQYLAILGHYSWLLWRTGRHAENLALMEEFFPAGTSIPAHILSRFATSARFAGNETLARNLMLQYHKKFGATNLWKSYAAARLSADCGGRDEKIDLVLEIGDEIMAEERAGTLREMLAGKRVAVVGNGPQEIGSGNGEKIDAHDVVIRFNDFPCSPEFRKDYGAKTDIWVRSQWVPAAPKRIADVVVGDALHSEYPDLNILREIKKSAPARIFAIPAEIYHETHCRYGLNHPSNGALMLAWIKSLCPDFSADDVFGFSFKAEIPPKTLDHYYDSPDLQKGSSHNLDKERVFLRNLFGMDAN